jgi:hypothetical protein
LLKFAPPPRISDQDRSVIVNKVVSRNFKNVHQCGIQKSIFLYTLKVNYVALIGVEVWRKSGGEIVKVMLNVGNFMRGERGFGRIEEMCGKTGAGIDEDCVVVGWIGEAVVAAQ